jgi:cobalt/nickel transport system permease protein
MASVLTVQAFFFADGGLLALGCNIFNLGFFPAFVAYPLIYRAIVKGQYGTSRALAGTIIAAVASLQLGAFSVVLETQASSISELPFSTFVLMMLPIHLAIGVVEGLATAAVISFVAKARPEVLPTAPETGGSVSIRPVVIGLALAAVVIGGVASWFASTHPDGLEWSMAKVSGKAELESPGAGIHESLAKVQEKTAFLPDYGFKPVKTAPETAVPAEHAAAPEPEPWPAVNAGTSLAGIVGGFITLGLACLVGVALKTRSIKRACGNG